jgi:phage tail tape-measure protein
MDARKPRLLRALNELYQGTAARAERAEANGSAALAIAAAERGPSVPWLSGPEDSWL